MAEELLKVLRLAVECFNLLPDAIRYIKIKVPGSLDGKFECFSAVPLTQNYNSLDGRKLNTEDEDEALAAKNATVWLVESKLGRVENPLKYKIFLASSSSCKIVCAAAQAVCQNKGYINLGRLGNAKVLDIIIFTGL